MKKILLTAGKILLIMIVFYSCATPATTTASSNSASGFSKADWKEFSQNVRKIYIWTHTTAPPNPNYNYSEEALAAIQQKFQRLGYQTEVLWYSSDSWKIDDMKKGGSLNNGEAFIELVTWSNSWTVEKNIPGERTVGVVRDSYGRPVYSVNEKTSTTRTKTKGTATASVNVHYHSPVKGDLTYYKSFTVHKDDISIAVNYATYDILKIK